MNNQQFRRLLIDTKKQEDGRSSSPASSKTPGTVLGARKHASIPMTPRQVGRGSVQADFARQLVERNAKGKPVKKFRSSAPKGTQLIAGYTDRTKERDDTEDDETAKRIKNLEETMKLGQIDRETFEKLVQDITGGDVASTHLVKGLDRKLLERVRKGEDVFSGKQEEEDEKGLDVDHAFDELADQEVGAVVREKTEKKGEMAPPPPVAGVKRSRNDILAELKRQHKEAVAAAAAEHEKKYPSLGAGFRKVNANGETTRIETDAYGREVLIITDATGKEKRKVRKKRVEPTPQEIRHDLDDENKPINMHNVPAAKEDHDPASEEATLATNGDDSDEDDIFTGVGSNYNPLAQLNDEDESSSEEEGEADPRRRPKATVSTQEPASDKSPPTSTSHADVRPARRDYFKTINRTLAQPVDTSESSTADATVRAALQKVRTLDPNSALLNDPDSQETRLKRRAAELAAKDRDMEDIDMGFGGSRFDDAEDMERDGEKVKFSEWKGLGADEDEDEEGDGAKGGKKRKRGPKKKKGNKNSASDVLKVMEKQKKALG